MPTIAILDKSIHNRSGFTCGVEALDLYIKQQAAKDVAAKVCVCYVLQDDADPSTIVGFYTLSNLSVILGKLPEQVVKRLPKYPDVSATLIGRLAVSREHQRQGHGKFLLMDALKQSYEASKSIGSALIVVDPKGEKEEDFFAQYGFQAFQDAPLRLFLPMEQVKQLFVD